MTFLPYPGIGLATDGFDCALPVAVDSYSVCSYGCLYCSSEQLMGHRHMWHRGIRQTDLACVEKLFSGSTDSQKMHILRKALKYDTPNVHGYPCPIRLGGRNDPFDDTEREQGWSLEFIRLAQKYNQPVIISTKGTCIADEAYLAEIAKKPELFWVSWSINTIDYDKAKVIDALAPSPSQRLQAMRKLSKLGCKTSLRMRPIWPGVTDATRRHPRAYADLIRRAADAGACAISCEVGSIPTQLSPEQEIRWRGFEQFAGMKMRNIYKRLGEKQTCWRPGYRWTEQIMHAIYGEAKKCGLSIGISDPVWRQLTTTGCCCGIKANDPVFGNWQRQNVTNAMYETTHNFVLPITHELVIPPWTDEISARDVRYIAGNKRYDRRFSTWRDKLIEIWDNPNDNRNPLRYLQGAWRIHGRDTDGHLVYRYRGLERQEPKHTTCWYIERLCDGQKTSQKTKS